MRLQVVECGISLRFVDVRSFVGSLVRWFVASLLRWFVASLVCCFVRCFVASFTSFVGSLVRSFVGSFVRSFVRWFVHFVRSLRLFVRSFVGSFVPKFVWFVPKFVRLLVSQLIDWVVGFEVRSLLSFAPVCSRSRRFWFFASVRRCLMFGFVVHRTAPRIAGPVPVPVPVT